MPNDTPTPPAKGDTDRRPLGSPYGPQPEGTDEAAGGADSSPLETVPTDERKEKADETPGK
jgi:hypothetical protein